MTVGDWIAIYGASLSTLIAAAGSFKFFARKFRAKRERHKFQTDLYFLRKIDRTTKETHPIVVLLVANLGTERISLKSLNYEGISENGLPTTGCTGGTNSPRSFSVLETGSCALCWKAEGQPIFR
jgi:hypothetical protein